MVNPVCFCESGCIVLQYNMLTLLFSGQSLYKRASVQLNDRSLVGSIEDALKLMSLILFFLIGITLWAGF